MQTDTELNDLFEALIKLPPSADPTQLCTRILRRDGTTHGLPPRARAFVATLLASALSEQAKHLERYEAISLLKEAVSLYNTALNNCDMPTMISSVEGLSLYVTIQVDKGSTLALLADWYEATTSITLLKQAVNCYNEVLAVPKVKAMTNYYAACQVNKGIALWRLARRYEGREATACIEQALACSNVALDVLDKANDARSYAEAQMNKAIALKVLAERRGKAEALRLLEQALGCCNTAGEIFDGQSTTRSQGLVRQHKGQILAELANLRSGTEATRIFEEALACYDAALSLFDMNSMVLDYATVQQSKGYALVLLAEQQSKTRAQSLLQQSITCYEVALQLFDKINLTTHYATTQLDKSHALAQLAELHEGDAAIALLEQGIDCCDIALTVFKFENMVFDQAKTQMNKGNFCFLLAEQYKRAEAVHHYNQAITCYSTAQTIFNAATEPQHHRTAAFYVARSRLALALLLADRTACRSELDRAWEAAASGLKASRLLEQLAPSLEFRQTEWSENVTLYSLAGTIQALRGATEEAVMLLETGRARGLAQALERQRADLNVLTRDERAKYEAAVNTVLALEARSRQGGDFRRASTLVAEAEAANAALNAVVERLRQAHPTFLPELDLSLKALTSSLRSHEILTYLIPQDYGTLLLAVSWRGEIRVEWFADLTKKQLYDLLIQYDDSGNLHSYLLAIIGQESMALNEILDALLPALGERLMRRVVRVARELGAKSMVVVPGRFLAVLPLHAAMYKPLVSSEKPTAPGGRRYACDDLLISYTPGGATYLATRTAVQQRGKLKHGFVVGNPKQTPAWESQWKEGMRYYLPYAAREAASVATIMSKSGLRVTSKIGAEATRQAVIDGLGHADVVHLAMHAVFESSDPLNSALLVAPQVKLLLRDLLNPQLVSLKGVRLAVLSACQSGLVSPNRMPEEAVGLFGALLAAGAAGVVGSLWSVYDFSTSLLMEAFTQHYLQQNQEPALALHNATRWLRGLPDERPVGHHGGTIPLHQQETEGVRTSHPIAQQQWKARVAPVRHLSIESGEEASTLVTVPSRVPLEHPIYWAAFVYYGA